MKARTAPLLAAGAAMALALVLLTPHLRAQQAVPLDSIKIVVNDKAVTRREVEQFRDLRSQELRRQYEGEELQARLRALDKELTQVLVEDLLIESYASRQNIEISDEVIEERVDNIVRRQPALQEQYSDEQLKAFVLKDLLRRRVLGREVDARVRVDDEDIVAACRLKNQDTREVEVGHILLRDEGEATREKLAEIRRKLLDGGDFQQLADEYSQDPSVASNHGRLGFISRGQFVKPFEEAAFALPVGAVSDPVRTRFGLHLIKVFDQRSKGPTDCQNLDAVTRQSLSNQVRARRQAEQLDAFLARLKKQAEIRVYD